MEQMHYHPSVHARVNRLSKSYEKLRAAVHRTMTRIADFNQRSGPIFKQFAAYNDQLIQLIREEKVPHHLLRPQIETCNALADQARQFHAMYEHLILSGRPRVDRIVHHGTTLTQQLQTLQTLHASKESSQALMQQMEQQMDSLVQDHIALRQQLNACISAVHEMQATLRRSLN